MGGVVVVTVVDVVERRKMGAFGLGSAGVLVRLGGAESPRGAELALELELRPAVVDLVVPEVEANVDVEVVGVRRGGSADASVSVSVSS